MALKVKFADSKKIEIEYLDAFETEEYYNGNSRRTLSFEMAPGAYDLEKLNELCSIEANVAKLELINEEKSITNIHEGYVLKLKVGIEPKLINAETQTYEDRIVLKLGKRTYIEEKLHQLGI